MPAIEQDEHNVEVNHQGMDEYQMILPEE